MFEYQLVRQAPEDVQIGDVVTLKMVRRSGTSEELKCSVSARIVKTNSQSAIAVSLEVKGDPIAPGGKFSLPMRAIHELVRPEPEPEPAPVVVEGKPVEFDGSLDEVKLAAEEESGEADDEGESDGLDDFSYGEIQDMCQGLKLKANGKKVDLIQRIRDHHAGRDE